MFLRKKAQSTIEYVILFTLLAMIFVFAANKWIFSSGNDQGVKKLMQNSAGAITTATSAFTAITFQ